MTKRDLLAASDLEPSELANLLELAAQMKQRRSSQALSGRALGLLFFDRSLRTRVSFHLAMERLGGHCINVFAENELYDLEPEEQVVMDGAAEEHVKDAARTLSRYVDALGVRQISRTGDWERDSQDLLLRAYAEHASVPVINLESVFEHPCQAVADLMTMRENLRDLRGRRLTVAWSNHPEPRGLGPSHSIVTMAAMAGMAITVAHPLGFELDEKVMDRAEGLAAEAGGSLQVSNELATGAADAEVLYARSWGGISYWGDNEREAMVKRSLQDWRIDADVMAKTENALFMHPLPVRRNVVATDEVLDGPRSVIYDQAENRLPVSMALLAHWLA